jgi:hypothetical protein
MAAKNKILIMQEMKAHIEKQGGLYSSWYVGIAANAEKRLFEDHKVSKENGWWIHREALNTEDARAVEQYFFALGCKGGPGGGDSSTKFAYAYLITASTVE